MPYLRRGTLMRRGMGEHPGDMCYDPNRPTWLPYAISDLTELRCVMGEGAANVYSSVQYGTLPAPVAVAPNAPQTSGQMTVAGVWTPDQSQLAPGQLAAANAAAANAAATAGTWNPAGNLPLSATDLSAFFSAYGWPIAIGIGLLVATRLLK